MQELEGTTALVTGGDSGIGLGIARALSAAGVHVVVAGIVQESLDRAARELAAVGSAEAVLLDVRDREAFAALADRLDRERGGVDLLVNNAGVGFLSPAVEATGEQWDWVLGINLTGVWNGVRTVVPRMLAGGRPAHVVSTASIGGMLGSGGAVYAAAKFGVVGLMESLASELVGSRVGVSILVPGIVRTNIANGPPAPRGPAVGPVPGGLDIDDLYRTAMEPDEVGRRVLDGIRENRLHVFTHAEHGPLLERRFAAVLAAVPDERPDPRRAEVERTVLATPIYDAAPQPAASR